jgi:hypothetical protein
MGRYFFRYCGQSVPDNDSLSETTGKFISSFPRILASDDMELFSAPEKFQKIILTKDNIVILLDNFYLR